MKYIALITLTIALALPASALADSSTCQAYNPQLCNVASATTSPGSTSSGSASSGSTASARGTLPFTGLDVALLAVGGGVLLASGLMVRRVSRRLG